MNSGSAPRPSCLVAALAASAVLAGCSAFRHDPGEPRATPGGRNAHALFFDASRAELVLFGGADEQAVRRDTWAWNGTRWRRLTDEGPSARTFPAYASDRDGKAAYIFGGNRVLFGAGNDTGTFLSDLWRGDGARWAQQHGVGPSPDARAEAALSFDQRRRRLVLFGGYRRVGGSSLRLGDTWEWDGTRWTRMDVSGPAARSGMAMAYDAHRGVTVLLGGSTGTASGETWEWDGTSWTKSAATADPRFNSVMAYDPSRRRVVRFGGWYSGRRWGDTWVYDGTRWDSIAVPGPAPRNHAAITYDARRGSIVLLGGHDGPRVFGDLWEWRGDRWVELSVVPPKLRLENGH